MPGHDYLGVGDKRAFSAQSALCKKMGGLRWGRMFHSADARAINWSRPQLVTIANGRAALIKQSIALLKSSLTSLSTVHSPSGRYPN